jgi:enoyl-CoA hydratase/carnithine racemase
MDILTETRNHVAFMTLNRPAALNALSLEMVTELIAVLRAHAANPEVRALLIRGSGDRAFCAGGDIRALYESVQRSTPLHEEFFAAEYRLDYLLQTYPKPFIAVMDGITMGGGMGIAQGSRLRVVGERTRIAMPEVGIGLFPDVGGSYFLSRLPGALGTYLALTGVQIRAADALYSQLADVYLTPAAVAALPARLDALDWSEDAASDLRGLVHSLAAGDLAPSELAARDLAAPSLSGLRSAIDSHFGLANVPAILASLDSETRPEYAAWAATTAKLMRTRSPTMLCVALRQLERGRDMTLADCFRMELGMVRHCLRQPDFSEGVRAVIVDKDNAPRWTPSRLEDVDTASVEAFFQHSWDGGIHPLADLERSSVHA